MQNRLKMVYLLFITFNMYDEPLCQRRTYAGFGHREWLYVH